MKRSTKKEQKSKGAQKERSANGKERKKKGAQMEAQIVSEA